MGNYSQDKRYVIIMKGRNFDDDLKDSHKWDAQWEGVLKLLYPGYKVKWLNDLNSQLELGTDGHITDDRGKKYSFDVKGPSKTTFDTYILEVNHNIYHKEGKDIECEQKAGWFYRSPANIIIEGRHDGKQITRAIAFNLQLLAHPKNKELINSLPTRTTKPENTTIFTNGRIQRTIIKIITREQLRKHANGGLYRYWDVNEPWQV